MFLEKIKQVYEAFKEQAKQRPEISIFINLGILLLNLATRGITKEFITWAFLIIIGLYALYKNLTQKPLDYSPVEYHNALAPQVLESATFFCNSDPIFHHVKSAEDITDYDYIYNEDSDTYKFFIVKKEATNIDTEKLSTLAFKIERRINKRLRNINTRTIRTFDNVPPQIGIVGIEDIGGEVEISIYIANNPEKRQRLAQLKKEHQEAKIVVTADVDKTDDDF